MARPLPEFTGHRYKVSPTKAQPGFPVTDLEKHTMAVPLGNTPLERAIRAHEVSHALHTPLINDETLATKKVRIASWRAAEELRVNTLCERAQVDMSPMVFAADGAQGVAGSGDAREIARSYCTLSGAGRRSSFWRAWNEDKDDLDPKVRGLCERAFKRLDGYAAEPNIAGADWGFRVARYLDSLVDQQKELTNQKPKPKPQPKQPQQQGESKDEGQGASGGREDESDDWADVPDFEDEDQKDDQTEDQTSDTNDDEDDVSEDSGFDSNEDKEDDSDEYADGEDEYDPLDGMDSPHCDIDFNELVEADIQRALKQMAQQGAQAWATKPNHSMPGQVADASWMEFVLNEPPLTVPTENGKAARKPRAARSGRFRRGDQIFVDGGSPYLRNRPAPGGTVLVDVSGSMSVTTEEIETILRAAPGATIAVYNSQHGLKVIIRDGMRVAELPRSGGSNAIDGPALRWLAEQDGPRVWVSDNLVNGGYGGNSEAMYRECAEICLAAKIQRVAPYSQDRYGRSDMMVPAAFVGYEQTAKALADYHRNYSR